MSVRSFSLRLSTLAFLGLASCASLFPGRSAIETCPSASTSYAVPDGYSRIQAKSRGHINILFNNVFIGRSPMDKLIPSQSRPLAADVDVGGQIYPIVNYWGSDDHFNTNLFNVSSGKTVKLGTFLPDGGKDDFDSSSCNMGHYGEVPRDRTRLVIHTNPEGLTVLLDGRPVGKTPIDLLVPASQTPPLLVFSFPNGKPFSDDEFRIMLMGGDTLKIYQDTTGQMTGTPPLNPGPMSPPSLPSF